MHLAEILHFSISSSLAVENAVSTAGQAGTALISCIKGASGSNNIYWGRKLEDRDVLVLAVGKQIYNGLFIDLDANGYRMA